MGRPRKGEGGKSKIVTFRMSIEDYNKMKRLHPQSSEWLRDRMHYDITRKHTRKKRQ